MPSNLLASVSTHLIRLPRAYKRLATLLIDAVLLFVAFYAALWLRFDLLYFSLEYAIYSLVAVPSALCGMYLLGAYHSTLRSFSSRSVFSIVGGIVLSIMAIGTVDLFLRILPAALSRGFLVLYACVAIAALALARVLLVTFAGRSLYRGVRRVPVLIYGAGNAGQQLASALKATPQYHPVAFIDDEKSKQGLWIAGLRAHSREDILPLVERYQVEQIFLAMPRAERSRLREITLELAPHHLQIRSLPPLAELIDSEIDHRKLRTIRIEDLLGRDPVPPIPALIRKCVAGKSVMVTGAGGSIGSELCAQILAQNPTRLVLLEVSEAALYTAEQQLRRLDRSKTTQIVPVLGNVRNKEACFAEIQRHGVQTIYHAAAYKHVPIVEHNIAEGVLNNAFGTLSMVEAAIDAGVEHFVLISTDKAVRPTNIMGTTKRLAELILQAHARIQQRTQFCMVRFGNVLGSSGSVVPLFRSQIHAGGPITITHPEIIRYFMTIPEAAQLVMQAGAMGRGGDVFVLDMGEPVKIIDLARRMIQLSGLEVRDEENPYGDIGIEVTGLRPGEKLYEELLIGSNVESTDHARIMRANEQELEYAALMNGLAKLSLAVQENRLNDVVSCLRALVPEYACQLDLDSFTNLRQAVNS
ncbi:polysaccharide biosynthesis protein [Bordetella genomosp. 1]|uniref:Polysaccharide biosynthesis protein n=1 Tax=Bordetella genomosp. 1 TaxID=1395607 RepID=A0ABX4F3J1_9BORD|nr:nucleoside-diphosphate sugar epimerase/dehydratase [Bordetella genomosp. 1]OZI68288.1 polysaccharide biosynthesis protein [Bordetella genomosp. 1]